MRIKMGHSAQQEKTRSTSCECFFTFASAFYGFPTLNMRISFSNSKPVYNKNVLI
jgi:hypothetical protein